MDDLICVRALKGQWLFIIYDKKTSVARLKNDNFLLDVQIKIRCIIAILMNRRPRTNGANDPSGKPSRPEPACLYYPAYPRSPY